jgi:hypothetical protein
MYAAADEKQVRTENGIGDGVAAQRRSRMCKIQK